MADMRPWGFRDYIKSQGFRTLYVVKPVRGWPIKIGIANDPERRLNDLQVANFETLCFHRFWWMPGLPITSRIEAAFKRDFAAHNIRGEWFDVDPSDAVAYVENAIEQLNTWALTQSQMEHLLDRWARNYFTISDATGPSPLRGSAPCKDEPWQRRTEQHRPSTTRCVGDCDSP